MEFWVVAFANVAGLAVLFGGVVACVRFDQKGKTRRRELEHNERMRAIELGRPLDDAAVARFRALGAVGVAVPVTSLSAAVIGGSFVLVIQDSVLRLLALAVVWGVCGLVCMVTLPVVLARLREPPFQPRNTDERDP